jgi:hypothetical protein
LAADRVADGKEGYSLMTHLVPLDGTRNHNTEGGCMNNTDRLHHGDLKFRTTQAQRDQNPHKAAVVAMWLYGARYAKQALGSMGFWDSLTESEREMCRNMVDAIEKARPE